MNRLILCSSTLTISSPVIANPFDTVLDGSHRRLVRPPTQSIQAVQSSSVVSARAQRHHLRGKLTAPRGITAAVRQFLDASTRAVLRDRPDRPPGITAPCP